MKGDKVYRLFSVSLDLLVITLSFFLSRYISKIYFKHFAMVSTYWLIYALIIVLYLFFTTRFKISDYRYFDNSWRVAKDASKSLIFSFCVVAFLVIIFQYNFLNRSFFFLFLLFSVIMVYISQSICLYVYSILKKRRGTKKRYVLMVGTDFAARSLAKDIEEEVFEEFEIIGFLMYYKTNKKRFMGYKVLGNVSDLENIISSNVVDMIMVFPNQLYMDEVREIIKICEIEGVEIFVYSSIFDLSIADMSVMRYNGRQIVKFIASEKEPYLLLIKRIIDAIGSFILLTILSPVFLATALAIKIESNWKGPIFYAQERSGINGRKFNMYKFRSMIVGADKMKEKLQKVNEAEGPVFKVKNDPRITKVGAFIRKYSIDELPQLYNVLIGDMSLVGPRPPIPTEVIKYDRWQRRRLSMRPGITCIWQVSGRSNIPFKKWVLMDLEYIDNWSILLDFQLLIRTIPAVFMGRGAC